MTLLYLIIKKVHLSFLITSILILCLGVANQTKILYRDDIVKFEDLLLIKEAATMTTRYDILIKWYTIVAVIIIIIITLLLKRYIKKLSINLWKRLIIILIMLITIFCCYKLLYKNDEIYESIGKKELINKWITTRQYQIRGLIYPFIYTIEDFIDTTPDGYDEDIAKEKLGSYEYEDIPEDKKVNIIAIMLEAYNDFSKFDVIDFNEDIYEEFHTIQNKSISGNLVTNIFGGGTIVSERNFLTGYNNFPNFRKNANSYAWYFKEQGYRTEAMHPIYGAFYNRASINPNLGFDKYYYYENTFRDISDSFLEDYDFFDYIIKGYEESKEDEIPYFNFSVTYQNHGPYYGGTYEGKEYYFDNENVSEETYNVVNEYFHGIKKTNIALNKLINYFENEEEATIIILYGDHNPYLGDAGYNELGIDIDLGTIEGYLNYYQTPYIIYGNNAAKSMFNKTFEGKGNDISPIFLMNELFEYIGLSGNEYMQYISNLKENIDVISNQLYKEDNKYVRLDDSNYKDKIEEYNYVSYYYSRNYGGK